ncbi:MAG: PAS domain S-box protein [Acidobacteriota bacterium]
MASRRVQKPLPLTSQLRLIQLRRQNRTRRFSLTKMAARVYRAARSGRELPARESSESGLLRTTAAILRAQQEATRDGILVVDRAGKILSVNRRFFEIWQISPSLATTQDDKGLLSYAKSMVIDPREFLSEVAYLYNRDREVRTDDRVPLKDGRVLSRASVPVIDDTGEVAGRAWYFRDISDEERAAALRSALFRISEVAHTAPDLTELYRSIHRIVGELMDATNFSIALYDEPTNALVFDYYVDQKGSKPPDASEKGLTWYVLRTGQPLLATPTRFKELIRRGELESVVPPAVDWIGVPLLIDSATIGVLGVQSYTDTVRYGEKEKEILLFVSQHIASAIAYKKKEDALRGAKEQSENLIMAANAIITHLDGSGRIQMVNEMAERVFGYANAELRGRNWLDLLQPSARPRHLWEESAFRRGRPLPRNLEFTILNRSGEERQISWYNNEVREGEALIGTVCIGIDVTERRLAEEGLRESENRYRQMFENNPAVKLLIDPTDGRIVDANDAATNFYGYSFDELTSKHIWEINALSEDELRSDLDSAANQTRNLFSFHHKVASGEIRDVEVNTGPIRVHGKTLLYSIVNDVTDRKRAEEALQESEVKYRKIVDFGAMGIIQVDVEGHILTANKTFAQIVGFETSQEVLGRNVEEFYVRPEDRINVMHSYDAGETGGHELQWRRRDDSPIWVHLTGHSVADRSGTPGYYESFVHDITDRKHAEEVMHNQAAAFAASMDGMAILDNKGCFTYLNDAHARLYGYMEPEALVGKSWQTLYDERESTHFSHEVMPRLFELGHWRGAAVGLRRDGSSFPQEVSLTALENGGMVCVVRDTTERSLAEEQIRHLAYHDVLTGLPNRLLLKDRLSVALSRAQREKSEVAVLFLDLDNFKKINDSLGHNIGDRLLQEVASRLTGCTREADTVARLGGDEFVILLPMLAQAEDAVLIARKVLEIFKQPFRGVVEGRDLFLTTSIGISVFPEDGRDPETILKNADTAMYQAKEFGRDNYQMFNALISANALERLALENGLRKAVDANELRVFYQPIYDMRTGRIDGMEALVRWEHPHLGLLAPGDFIPLAEQSGQMNAIGAWILRTACEQLHRWEEKGFSGLTLAVNLAVSQLQHPDLVHTVMTILRETQMSNGSVELEITESGAMLKPDTTIRSLQELKRLGVRISLDDFGIGHSSLAYLKRFPIDTLKIDQSFVRDITKDPETAAIVTAIIAMARTLKLKLIAEGVENEEQRSFLMSYGCYCMQGFLFNRPIPPDQFEALLVKNRATTGKRSRFPIH